MVPVMTPDKRRQQASRVVKRLSLEKLVIPVGRRLNWCGRQHRAARHGENCMALRGQRADHA